MPTNAEWNEGTVELGNVLASLGFRKITGESIQTVEPIPQSLAISCHSWHSWHGTLAGAQQICCSRIKASIIFDRRARRNCTACIIQKNAVHHFVRRDPRTHPWCWLVKLDLALSQAITTGCVGLNSWFSRGQFT